MSVCEEREEEASVHTQRAASPVSSCVSMKSNSSMMDPPKLSDGPAVTFDPVKRKRAASPVSNCLTMKATKISDGAVTFDPVVDHGSEVKEFMMTSRLHRYAVDLTLDPNTANIDVALSEENRKVTCVSESQSYPDHPERFECFPQTLSTQNLTGRCYWECEWSGDDVDISVSYKGIQRKGVSDDCEFGWNEKSWSLFCSGHTLTVLHNSKSTAVSAGPGSCKRAGVFVDVPAGTLSFYSVSDTHTLTPLHTFTHTFTEPLCAGFGVYNVNSSVSLCHITQQTPTH